MDALTENLLGALDPVGVELLLVLLRGPATEAALLVEADGLEQSTCNRRLHRLGGAGLIDQEPGTPGAPHRRWQLLHAEETEGLLSALLDLADAIDLHDRLLRDRNKQRLRVGRAARLGIRLAANRNSKR